MGLFMCSNFSQRVLNKSAIAANVLFLRYETNDKTQKYEHISYAFCAWIKS
ncbi:hypothetical protein SAMN04515647_1698 [Cohaesibacter sp. ES.047]|nr:hypothetical protein SAMN04515647_1698 [Cohaesibacter sp. ES.047]